MLSLAYSFISLAFQMNFFGGVPHTGDPTQVTPTVDGYKNAAAWGHGTFPVYWMLNFFGMIALGLACENVAMIVGQPWYVQALTTNNTQLTVKQDWSMADLLGNHQRVDRLL
jgi:hypothetical protein